MNQFETVKTDWKGNHIAPGQTLVVVTIKPMFVNHQMFFPMTGETIDLPKVPEHIWEPVYEVDVVDIDGRLFYRSTGEGVSVTSPLIKFLFPSQPNFQIVCIKGLSDNEQDYYNTVKEEKPIDNNPGESVRATDKNRTYGYIGRRGFGHDWMRDLH